MSIRREKICNFIFKSSSAIAVKFDFTDFRELLILKKAHTQRFEKKSHFLNVQRAFKQINIKKNFFTQVDKSSQDAQISHEAEATI